MHRMMGVAPRRAPVARVRLIDLGREYRTIRDDLLAACERVLDRMQLLGGEEVRAFEREMAAYLGAAHAKGVASGTDALRLGIRAAGIDAGDEVLIQANAFVAAVEALVDADARPVPVDIQLGDLGPDPADLAARIGARTRAILVVHLHGFPVDMEPVLALARERGLVVVEDCSHAHGATLDGRRVGTFGAVGTFSFGVVKNLAAYGDAGAVSTDDPAVAEQVKLLGTHGQVRKNDHAGYGGHRPLDELHAAVLRVKLRGLDVRNARRADIASYYSSRFAGRVLTPAVDARRTHVFHQYVIRTPVREALRRYLAEHEIETGIHYPVPL